MLGRSGSADTYCRRKKSARIVFSGEPLSGSVSATLTGTEQARLSHALTSAAIEPASVSRRQDPELVAVSMDEDEEQVYRELCGIEFSRFCIDVSSSPMCIGGERLQMFK